MYVPPFDGEKRGDLMSAISAQHGDALQNMHLMAKFLNKQTLKSFCRYKMLQKVE